MTELYQAYGGLDDMSSKLDNIPNPDFQEQRQERQDYQERENHDVQENQRNNKKVNKPVQQDQQAQLQAQIHAAQIAQQKAQNVEKFSNHSGNFQGESFQDYSSQKYGGNGSPSYSFWDRMTLKRTDVIKLAIFSLVIVLAIALDRMGTHYLTKYLSDNVLTDFQEFMLRLSYPVIIFILLWIVKSL